MNVHIQFSDMGMMCRLNWYIILIGMVLVPVILCSFACADGVKYNAPGIGYIEIRSDQEGARVYFDTLYMGFISGGVLTVPVDTTVSPVWKNVRVEYTGYQSFTGPFVQTEPGKTTAYQINLSHIPYNNCGIVKFHSKPDGCDFILNGREIGSTPDSGTLILYTIPRGYYQVEARKPGYTTIKDQLYIDDNAVTTYRVDLKPSPLGSLEVKSLPDGANIFLDNRNVGITPLTIDDVPVGEHSVIIRKDEYQDWSVNVSVLGGSMGTIESVLVSKPSPPCVPENNTSNMSQ
jgi:hypothetical protein